MRKKTSVALKCAVGGFSARTLTVAIQSIACERCLSQVNSNGIRCMRIMMLRGHGRS